VQANALRMRSKTKTSLQSMVRAVICLLMAITGPRPAVLCLGADGHVAIEALSNHCCESLPACSAEGSRLVRASADSNSFGANKCCSRLHIPLPVGQAGVFEKVNQVNPTTLALTTVTPVAINSCSGFSEYNSALEVFITTPYFIPLRSVILLI
jgi:hypothetical protein